jgi:hypothetical protein
VEALNAGSLPAPYYQEGIGGRIIQTIIVDEAGGTTHQVSEYRNLVQRDEVDVVIGTQSSGQGHETSFCQVAAEWLGVPFETVKLRQGILWSDGVEFTADDEVAEVSVS